MGLTDVVFVHAEKIGYGPEARTDAISAATATPRGVAANEIPQASYRFVPARATPRCRASELLKVA